MRQKSRKPVGGILQKWEMIEITDPGEIDALERRIRAAEKSLAERDNPTVEHQKSKAKPRKRSR